MTIKNFISIEYLWVFKLLMEQEISCCYACLHLCPSASCLHSWKKSFSFPPSHLRPPLPTLVSLLSLLCELIPCMTATLILFTDSFHPRQNKPSWYVSGCRSGSFFSWMSQHWFLAPCNKASFSQFDQWVLCIFLCLAVAMSNQEWWDFFFSPVFTVDCVKCYITCYYHRFSFCAWS